MKYKSTKKAKKWINIRIDEDAYKALKLLATKRQESMSYIITMMVRSY